MLSCAINTERIVCQRWNIHFLASARRGNWPWPIANYCFTFQSAALKSHSSILNKSVIFAEFVEANGVQVELQRENEKNGSSPETRDEQGRTDSDTPGSQTPCWEVPCVLCTHARAHTRMHTLHKHVIYLFLNSLSSYWCWQCFSFPYLFLYVEEKSWGVETNDCKEDFLINSKPGSRIDFVFILYHISKATKHHS